MRNEVKVMRNLSLYQLHNLRPWDTISMPITFSCLKSFQPVYVSIATRGHKGKRPLYGNA